MHLIRLQIEQPESKIKYDQFRKKQLPVAGGKMLISQQGLLAYSDKFKDDAEKVILTPKNICFD